MSRVPALLTAVAAFAVGGFLAANYPLGQFAAPVLILAASALAFYRPAWFLVIIPALLPVISLAPWTGWITFEEVDLLVLATAGGGYAWMLVDWPLPGARSQARLDKTPIAVQIWIVNPRSLSGLFGVTCDRFVRAAKWAKTEFLH